MGWNIFGDKKAEEYKKPEAVEGREETTGVQTVMVEGRPVVIDDEPTISEEKQSAASTESQERVIPVEGPDPKPAEEELPIAEEIPAAEEVSVAEEEKTEDVKPTEEKPTAEEQQAPDYQKLVAAALHQLSQKIDIIQRSNETRQKELTTQLEEKENIILQQHNQLLKFQDDVIYKTQRGLIMELIGLADNVRTILAKQKENKDYDDLMDDVARLAQWIDSSLEENGVRKFEEAATLGFNPKRQSISETQQAPQPELAGTYVTEQPGYEWSVPYVVVKSDVQLQKIIEDNKVPNKFSYVIRQEEVIKLK